MIKKLVAGLSVWVAASSALFIAKSGSSNDIVFGNYSDYISPDVAQELKEKYKLRVDLFDYDHLVKERFEKGIYDIAIVSTSVLSELKHQNSTMKLDWSKLLSSGERNEASQNKTSKDAEALFTDIVKDMSSGLLDYGIPYFVQKLSFYYKGEVIPELSDNKQVSFKTLIEKISEEERFKSKDGKPTIGLIDDPRTVLSLARKVGNKKDVNPSENEYPDSNAILKDYKSLIEAGLSNEKLGNNFLYMTPDSGPLVDALSDGSIKGAFMYNGDGYFASIGGNAEITMKKDKFHTVELTENIFFLDFLAFSSKMTEDKKKRAHNLAKKLLFISEENKSEPFKKKENEEMLIRNFDFVGYTPTIKEVYEKLDEKYFEEEGVSNDLKKKILKVEKTDGVNLENEYEKELSKQNKSDMLIAYNKFKSLL